MDKFDAVVLKPGHLRADKFAKVYAEKERSANQIYIFKTIESPRPELKGLINEKYFSKRFFNWTWTYRADSEITESYGYLMMHEVNLIQLMLPELDITNLLSLIWRRKISWHFGQGFIYCYLAHTK